VTVSTTTAPVAALTVSNLTVWGKGDSLKINHDNPSGSIQLIKDTTRSGRLGPLQYSFIGLSVQTQIATNGKEIVTIVEFDRLILRLVDDPQTFIVFKGKVTLSPTGASINDLEIVEPFSTTLVKNAATALVAGTRAVATFLASLNGVSTEQLKQLLEILGKLSAAVAKTVLFVGGAVADAADLMVSSLNALAEGLIEILSELTQLAPTPPTDLQIEVRLGLDPIELRQILITFKDSLSPSRWNAAGVALSLGDGWRPGVLLDFVDNPGGYFVLSRDSVATDIAIMDIDTDLWLENDAGDTVSHMPDADAESGGRHKVDRLIKLNAKLKSYAAGELIVVYGLQRGVPIFLRKLEGNLTSSGGHLALINDTFTLSELKDVIDLTLNFKQDRLLPLLGMGETGTDSLSTGATNFLDKLKQGFGQVVWVDRFTPAKDQIQDGVLKGDLTLGIKAAGVTTQAKLNLALSLETLRVKLDFSKQLELKSKRIEENFLGLTWVIEQIDKEKRKYDEEIEMFKLSFADGESGFGLNSNHAQMELRFDGLSSDGQGVVFEVSEFFVSRRGIDISAKVKDRAVRLNGLDVPFRFQTGNFTMRAGRLVEASISGRGTLPPALVGEADCTLALAFTQDESGIVLQSGKVEIDKKGEPIVCHSTRFTLTLTDIDVGIQKDGGYHFYFLITGSLRFTPKKGEFEGGLLGFLKDIEINLERTPLTSDASVLAKHISFQKTLTPKKAVTLFNTFTFELRGFGFHPSCARFDGAPAINLSGQIKFAEIGDVMQPKIDFHGLWIAPPKKGEALPRISAEGLGIDLQLASSVKIRGAVLAVDPSTKTVEGKEFAPEGYNTYGFLGEGEVEIPGWGCMQVSMGFLEVERKSNPGERRKAFFVYLQKDQLAVEIPTPFWTFYMREVGFGLGYRYTLAAIRGVDEAKSIAARIKVLDDASKRQGDLARFSAWSPEGDGDRITLAMRAALQAYPANKTYDQKAEENAENPFFFDVILAIRSDFTLLASMRGYLGVNYADFRANKDNFRERPGLRGYLYISAPRSEFLARMIGDSKGFIGERFPGLQTNQPLRQAIQSVDWSALLYIRPGLFHYELGWPDQLKVKLIDNENAKLNLRGGMIFRAADDGLLWGYNIEIDGKFTFSGKAGGSTGVSVEGVLIFKFLARILAFLSWQVRGSMVYGLVALDTSLEFKVRAWMEVDLRFKSFTLRTGFSFSVQISAAVEIAVLTEGVGGRGRARIAVSVFGCTLGVGVSFAFNDKQLDRARLRVQRYMAMSLTAEEPETEPAIQSQQADKRIDSTAIQEQKKAGEPTIKPKLDPAPAKEVGKPQNKEFTDDRDGSRKIKKTNFLLVMHQAPLEGKAYALLVPDTDKNYQECSNFYGAPPLTDKEEPFTYKLFGSNLTTVKGVGENGDADINLQDVTEIKTNWAAKIPVDNPEVKFTLNQLFDECFLSSTEWDKDPNNENNYLPKVTGRLEPKGLNFKKFEHNNFQDDAARLRNRDEAQRQYSADSAENMWEERAHETRSTVLTLFLNQFVEFAKTGARPTSEAHVLDLGLMFYGTPDELEQLEKSLKVYKYDQGSIEEDQRNSAGSVRVLNPPNTWFERQDPIFRSPRKKLAPNGFCLAWDLELPWTDPNGLDPEHFLLHYEIRRTIEGRENSPRIVNIKPAATMGGRSKNNVIQLYTPDWQYTDDFSDLPTEWRRALLPTSNEADALTAVKAWVEQGLGDDISLTYSITPVDIAGTRGLEKSFSYIIERPIPPVRAAEAEIRIVQMANKNACQAEENHPNDLEIYIALNDKAWTQTEDNLPITDYNIVRSYELVIEQENIYPSGAYAAGGATDKIQGMGTAGAITSPLRYAFVYKDLLPILKTSQLPSELEVGESGDETIKRLNLWGTISGKAFPGKNLLLKDKEKFLNDIWSNRKTKDRVAARFWLRTRIEYRAKDGKTNGFTLESKYVAVACELKIVKGGNEPVAFRPEAFEWPVHLELPPLTTGQVRAKTGFLHHRVPTHNATLSAWANSQGVKTLRDAERRTVTHLEFDAVPNWPAVNDLHLSSVAGFDVHQLDLDELAPLDTTSKKLEEDKTAWKRARRVANIELLTPEMAALVPSHNADWQSWEAHYPSETWRLDRSDMNSATSNGAQPTRKPWYSARETTPRFPSRFPRMRLLLQPPESVIVDLMRFGPPTLIKIKLKMEPDSPAAKIAEKLAKFRIFNRDLDLDWKSYSVSPPIFDIKPDAEKGEWTASLKNNNEFSISSLRYLLLSLCWECPGYAVTSWLENPKQLNGLTLEIVSELKKIKGAVPRENATANVPLDFTSPFHPILEEVIAELSLDSICDGNTVPSIYRAYEVMIQPEQPVDAKDLISFMATKPPGIDPYGWSVLHALGLSATLRIYDKAKQSFLEPQELAERVNRVLSAVIKHWNNQAKFSSAVISAQIFAEVLLKPGHDRILREFNSQVAATEESIPVSRDESGLAMMQISLRPKPEQIWNYFLLKLDIKQKLKSQPISIKFKIINGDESIDFCHAETRTATTLNVDTKEVIIQLPIKNSNFISSSQTIRLFVRHRSQRVALSEIKVDYEIVFEDQTSEKREDYPFTELISPIVDPSDESAIHSGISVYELFPEQSADFWSGALQSSNGFESLKALLRAAAPDCKFPQIDSDYKLVAAQYPKWAQRFLDHAKSPASNNSQKIALALAAPIKASPWRLAHDKSDCLRLYIPSDNRWAHTQAYAIQPISRYAHLMAAAGVMSLDEREKLRLEDSPTNIGNAVAVIPRTERIEPPVILGSSIQGNAWEIVTARHGEESLAASNRPLFARLGQPDFALTLLRSYRTPQWPTRLAKFMKEDLKDFELYPTREAELAKSVKSVVSDESNLTPLLEKRLNTLAFDIPSLWKGADIKSFRTLPPQYKLAVAAVARAGIVVSNPVVAIQDDLPRAEIWKNDKPGEDPHKLQPRLRLVRGDEKEAKTKFVISHRLFSHFDLTPKHAEDWNKPDDKNDVCWLPDPDVSYLLLHKTTTGSSTVTEELAEVRLVAEGGDDSKEVMVRTRGARWTTENVALPSIERMNDKFFFLEVTYAKKSETKLTLSVSSVEVADTDLNRKFSDSIKRFGRLAIGYKSEFNWKIGDGEDGPCYENRIKSYKNSLNDLIEKLKSLDKSEPPKENPSLNFELGLLKNAYAYFESANSALSDWIVADEENDSDHFSTRFGAALNSDPQLKAVIDTSFEIYLCLDGKYNNLLNSTMLDNVEDEKYIPPFVYLWDLPIDDEIDLVLNSNHPLALKNSNYWKAIASQVYSGATEIELKAIDARAKMPAQGDHLGIYKIPVVWPLMEKIVGDNDE
jgi:hypothetical protein